MRFLLCDMCSLAASRTHYGSQQPQRGMVRAVRGDKVREQSIRRISIGGIRTGDRDRTRDVCVQLDDRGRAGDSEERRGGQSSVSACGDFAHASGRAKEGLSRHH